MSKCSKVGCGKEGETFRYPALGGAVIAEIVACSYEHFQEARKSLDEAKL